MDEYKLLMYFTYCVLILSLLDHIKKLIKAIIFGDRYYKSNHKHKKKKW